MIHWSLVIAMFWFFILTLGLVVAIKNNAPLDSDDTKGIFVISLIVIITLFIGIFVGYNL